MSGRCAEWGHHRVRGTFAIIDSDTRRYLNRSPESRAGGEDAKHLLSAFLTPQVLALALHRVSHFLECRRWRRAAALLSQLNTFVHRVTISPRSCIGPACLLPHPAGVTFIGTAGREVTLYALSICSSAAASPDASPESSPRLGDGVSVGGHSAVIGPVSVGNHSRIAYHVRVDRDVPAGMLVVSPAVRVRFTPRGVAAGV